MHYMTKKMYFQIVLSDIEVIGSYWQLMLVISGYFDKKRDKKTKKKFLDLMNTQINHQNIVYCKIDHFTYKNKMYKL